MADETNNQNPNEAQQAQQQNADPVETGEHAEGRTFTQEDVDRIVRDRLARERAKAAAAAQETPPDPVAAKLAELAAREEALACRELIGDGKGAYPAELLKIFPTDDAKAFKAQADKLIELFPQLSPNAKIPRFTAPIRNASGSTNPLRQVFGLNPKG